MAVDANVDLADRAVPIDLDGKDGDLAPLHVLDDLAARARFAFLIEMDHAIHERHEFRLLCIRYLASRGWRWFGEELDWRFGERIDAFLRTGDDSLLVPVDDGRWYSSGWLADQTRDAPIEAMHDEHRRAAMALRRSVPDARWFGFDSGGGDPEFLRMANEVNSVEAALDWMAYREQLMHQRVAEVAKCRADDRIGLMAGGPHLAKDDQTLEAPGLLPAGGGRVPTIGHYVTHSLTDQPVLTIWMLHGGGRSASPYLGPTGELTVPDDTINAALAKRWDRPCLVVTHDDNVERRVAGMNNLTMSCRLSEQVDAIIFCPTVSPARIDDRDSE